MKKSVLGFQSWLLAVAGFALAPAAFAQSTCEADNDCDKGFSCEVTAVSGCAVPVCGEGANCPDVACESVEYRECVPGACEVDSDCSAEMVCQRYETAGSCSGSSVAPCDGKDCAPIAETDVVCEPSVVDSRCVERYNAACEESADCGEGFECVTGGACTCSGGASTGSSGSTGTGGGSGSADSEDYGAGDAPGSDAAVDGGATRPSAPPPPDDSCECQTYTYCQLTEVDCQNDSDCPADWSCETGDSAEPAPAPALDGGVSMTRPTRGSGDGQAADAGVSTGSDLAENAPPSGQEDRAPKPQPQRGTCLPPNYDYGRSGGDDVTSGGLAGEQTQNDPQDDGAVPPKSGEPGDVDDAEAAVDDAGAPRDTDDAVYNEESQGLGESSKGKGCSVAAPGSGSAPAGAWLLGALGLGFLGRRRRA